jgi:hypothetical protein
MRAIECTPGDIQNAGENRAQTVEPNSKFHLPISHPLQNEKPERSGDGALLRFQS